jgi:hypothetical protein
MRTVERTELVYQFNELPESGRNKAINSALSFFVEYTPYEELSESMQKACDKAEAMRTPWFTASYIWEYCQDEIEEFCNNYEYTIDGSIYK